MSLYLILILLFNLTFKINSCEDNNTDENYIPPTHIVIYQGGINQSFDTTKTFLNENNDKSEIDICKKEEKNISKHSDVIKYCLLAYNNWKPFTLGFLAGSFKGHIVKCAIISYATLFLFCKKAYRAVKSDGIRSELFNIAKSLI
jgi:hypothetical protein